MTSFPLHRRHFGLASLGAIGALATSRSFAGKEDCKTCRGEGLVPLKNRKPFVHIEGMPDPKPADAVRAVFCPECSKDGDPDELVTAEKKRLKSATEPHEGWEKETGWKLVRVESRHGTVHTLASAAEAQKMGLAMEALATHLQTLTGSMELTPTTPATYDLFVLWEKKNYEHFRKVLEKKYTAEQLGPSWGAGGEWGGYDLQPSPFFYETPETVVQRPFVHGALFFMGRRLISVATNWRAPTWLVEGFAEYCENAVTKKNLWYSAYDAGRMVTPGDWLFDVRRFGTTGKLRPLKDFLKVDIRDLTPLDYVQAFGLVKFVLDSDPTRFMNFVRALRKGSEATAALKAGTEVPVEKLQLAWDKWLRSR